MTDKDEIKGKLKQAAAELTGDEDLEREGKADETAGKVKEKFGGAVDKVKNLLHKD